MDHLNDENDLLYFKSLKPKKQNGFRKFEFICSECKETAVRNLNSISFPFLCKSCSFKRLFKERPEIIEKQKQTNIEHYGGVGFAASFGRGVLEQIKEKHGGIGFSSKTSKEKYIATMNERYNCDYPLQSEELQQRYHDTCNARFGTDWPSQNKNIVDKIKDSCIQHNGGQGFASPSVLAKYNETCIKKYGEGVDASKTYEANCRNRKKYIYDKRVFDSSWELAYYIWLKDHNESFEFHPKTQFSYVDRFGKTHKYNPDFLVGDQYVEIKGKQFLNENGELIDPFTNEVCKEKTECLWRNKIIILSKCENFIKFVKQKYGRNFIKNCRIGEKKNEY